MRRSRHLHIAEPLPECHLCSRPMGRDLWHTLGGLCRDCNDEIARIAATIAGPRATRPTDGDAW